MYAMIRRYSYKGTVDRKSIDDFKGRIESTPALSGGTGHGLSARSDRGRA